MISQRNFQRDSKDGLKFVRPCFLNYVRYVSDLHNIWKRSPKFSNTIARELA